MSDFKTPVCKNCGGKIEGDGYTTPLHCENVFLDLFSGIEPDAKIIYCTDNDSEDTER